MNIKIAQEEKKKIVSTCNLKHNIVQSENSRTRPRHSQSFTTPVLDAQDQGEYCESGCI